MDPEIENSLFSKDVMIGLFLGFWNKIALPDSRPLGLKNETPVDDLIDIFVSLDPSSANVVQNIDYWASDSRFFGIIGQQDYRSFETMIEKVGNKTFPFIAPFLGLDMSTQDTYRFVFL